MFFMHFAENITRWYISWHTQGQISNRSGNIFKKTPILSVNLLQFFTTYNFKFLVVPQACPTWLIQWTRCIILKCLMPRPKHIHYVYLLSIYSYLFIGSHSIHFEHRLFTFNNSYSKEYLWSVRNSEGIIFELFNYVSETSLQFKEEFIIVIGEKIPKQLSRQIQLLHQI